MEDPSQTHRTGRTIRAPSVSYVPCGDVFIALHPDRPRWAVVGEISKKVLEYCAVPEGRTVEEIGALLGQHTGSAPAALVSAWLTSIERHGLLEVVDGVDGPVRPADDFRVEHLYLEITSRCNLRCAHCFMRGGPGRQEHLGISEIRGLVARAASAGVRHVTISGGEPLLHPDFGAVVRAVAEAGCSGSVVTNATLLRDAHLDLLGSAGFAVGVSLDGITDEVNMRIRGTRAEPVLRQIDKLVAELGPARVAISFTPVAINLRELPGLFAFVESKDIGKVSLSIFEPVGRGSDNRDALSLGPCDHVQLVRAIYRSAVDLIGKVQIDLNDTRDVLGRFLPDPSYLASQPILRSVRVDSFGDVYPSSFGSSPAHRVGNVRETPIDEILGAPSLPNLARSLVDRFRSIPECRSCPWRQLCRGGSVTSAYYATGDVLRPDPMCEAYQAVFPEVAVSLHGLTASVP